MGSRLGGARMTDARVYPAAVYITTKTLTRFTTRVFSAPHGHVDALGIHRRPSASLRRHGGWVPGGVREDSRNDILPPRSVPLVLILPGS
jgi:hypothetical protein